MHSGRGADRILRLPGLPAIHTCPRILTIEPERELCWRTRLPGLAATHTFRLDDSTDTDDRTRFVQTERFEGPLADPILERFERASRRGCHQMNIGLRRRAERLVADD